MTLRTIPSLGNLRPASAELTPFRVERLLSLINAVHEEAEDIGRRRRRAVVQDVRDPVPSRREASLAPMVVAPGVIEMRPIAVTREPCFRCQTRGDLGCKHQAPMGALG